MKTFIAMILIALAVSTSAQAWDIRDIHCDYVTIIDGYQCSDNNEWYAPAGVVTQDMIDYYVGYMGLEYPTPNPEPDTFYVVGGTTETYN